MLSVIGDVLYRLLIDADCAQPLLHVEAWACLTGDLIMPDDTDSWVLGVEVEDVLTHGL